MDDQVTVVAEAKPAAAADILSAMKEVKINGLVLVGDWASAGTVAWEPLAATPEIQLVVRPGDDPDAARNALVGQLGPDSGDRIDVDVISEVADIAATLRAGSWLSSAVDGRLVMGPLTDTDPEDKRRANAQATADEKAYRELVARERAQDRRKRERAETAGVTSVADMILTADQIMDLEPPPPLVKDVLDGGGLSMLIGHRGSYKTAVALTIALSIVTGRMWGRHPTTAGRVLFLAGEGGGRAFGIRIEAWLAHHRLTVDALDGFQVLNGAAPFMSPAWDELVAHAEKFRPDFVVIDTLARHQVGLEENSNSDASDAIDKADHLRRQTGTAVMILHHPPKSGGNGRGATAWEAAADSLFHLETDEPVTGQVAMTTAKQKHRPDDGHWAFRIQEVKVRDNGIWPTSMVPVHADPMTVDAAQLAADAAADAALQDEVLTYIRGRGEADMAPNMTEFDRHFQETRRRESARDALQALVRSGKVRSIVGSRNAKRLHIVSQASEVSDA